METQVSQQSRWVCRADCKPSNTPALYISNKDPIPKPSRLWCPELSLETLQFHWKGLPCKIQRKAASPNGSDSLGPCLSSLHSRKLPHTTSYSLELFHKCTMVSYILPEAFENGADVVADCKLVVELASGSGVFHIWKREQAPKLSHQDSLATLLSLPASNVMSFKHPGKH